MALICSYLLSYISGACAWVTAKDTGKWSLSVVQEEENKDFDEKFAVSVHRKEKESTFLRRMKHRECYKNSLIMHQASEMFPGTDCCKGHCGQGYTKLDSSSGSF